MTRVHTSDGDKPEELVDFEMGERAEVYGPVDFETKEVSEVGEPVAEFEADGFAATFEVDVFAEVSAAGGPAEESEAGGLAKKFGIDGFVARDAAEAEQVVGNAIYCSTSNSNTGSSGLLVSVRIHQILDRYRSCMEELPSVGERIAENGKLVGQRGMIR